MKYDSIMLHLTIVCPNTKQKFNCPCMIPIDCLTMDKETLDKSYGKHLTDALYDLLNHKNFRKGLEKPKLLLSPFINDSSNIS